MRHRMENGGKRRWAGRFPALRPSMAHAMPEMRGRQRRPHFVVVIGFGEACLVARFSTFFSLQIVCRLIEYRRKSRHLHLGVLGYGEKEMSVNFRNVFFAKAFKAEEGKTLAAEINAATPVAGRRVVIIDHPPTAGLVPLIDGLMTAGAEVYLRDHHGDADRDGSTVARCREVLADRAVVSTRAADPACASLVGLGEFRNDIVVADADQDGVTAALKAIGISYPELDQDAAVLDGPAASKTQEALSSLGFAFVRAWGAIPAFGAPNRDKVFVDVVGALASAASGDQSGIESLGRLAAEYERKVEESKSLASTATEPFAGFRIVSVPQGAEYDPPTLASAMDTGVKVSARVVSTGPIAKTFGAQVSLARTKQGETAGVDLAKLVPIDWARGPEQGVISNTPFLLHLSPEKWEAFRPILLSAVAG